MIGYTTRLSADGSTLAVCQQGSNSFIGDVIIYKWNGTSATWEEHQTLQNPLSSDGSGTHFGGNIEVSTDGSIIAIASTGSQDRTGIIYVYREDPNNNQYEPLGSSLHDINADSSSIYYNENVPSHNKMRRIAMSGDGQLLAVGSPYYDKSGGLKSNVTIYRWNGVLNDWEIDQVLSASESDQRVGFGVAMSQDGQKLAVVENNGVTYYERQFVQTESTNQFVMEWTITNNDNVDFSNIVSNIESSPNLSPITKNLIRFSLDGSRIFIGLPVKDKVYILNSSNSATSGILAGEAGSKFGFNLDGSSYGTLAVADDPFSRPGGSVYVYEYIQSTSQWELRNTYIGSRDSQTYGDNYGDNYGYGISITNEYLAIGSPRQIETSLLEIYPLTKFQIKNNGTLVGIAKSIKLDEPSGSTDPSYIILPVNSFAQEVGSQTQSFVYENSSHHVHIRTDASLQNTPLTVSDKIKITPEGIIATFKDIHDGTSPIENNINILDTGKIRYEQDPLQFAEDTGSQKTINLYSSKNLFFSGKLDYDNNGNSDGEPIPDYEITDRGSGFDGVSSPVLSLQFERLNDPNNSNNYDPPIARADNGLVHVGITTPSMFLGKIQSVEIIDGGQDYTTDSIVEFKRNVDVMVKEGSLFLSLPDGHYVQEPYADEIQGEYIAEPSDSAVTLESLGITDYTLPNTDIKFVNANGYYMSGGGNNWYLIHPDTGKQFSNLVQVQLILNRLQQIIFNIMVVDQSIILQIIYKMLTL